MNQLFFLVSLERYSLLTPVAMEGLRDGGKDG